MAIDVPVPSGAAEAGAAAPAAFITAGEACEYVYSNVSLTFDPATEALEYVYLVVGLELPAVTSAVEYVYVNCGLFLQQTQEGHGYVYENIGVELPPLEDGIEYVYLFVTTDTPDPVLWFLRPNFGRDGDGFRLYCFGVGEFQATFSGVVELDWGGVTGWQTITVVSWQTIPANGDAYGPDRTFDEPTAHIDMEHTIIEAVIPAGTLPPGYRIRIRTDGP